MTDPLIVATFPHLIAQKYYPFIICEVNKNKCLQVMNVQWCSKSAQYDNLSEMSCIDLDNSITSLEERYIHLVKKYHIEFIKLLTILLMC